MIRQVEFVQPPLGCDVEFFWKQNGEIVESEKVLGKDGRSTGRGKVTNDGIQGEINPAPSTCRETLRSNIARMFQEIGSVGKAEFKSNVVISEKEFETISDASKVFGCNPSLDAYNRGKESKVSIQGSETRQRTAGGHIHMGMMHVSLSQTSEGMAPECKECFLNKTGCAKENSTYKSGELTGFLDQNGISLHDLEETATKMNTDKWNDFKTKYEKHFNVKLIRKDVKFNFGKIEKALRNEKVLIPLLDLFVGIPSVLIDSSPDAVLRRKLYGRAGDYRKPKHGIEYRVLSNFWIKSYPLMSLFTGLARHALLYTAESVEHPDMIKDIYSVVSKEEVRDAINKNDVIAARDIFLRVEKFIVGSASRTNNFPINEDTINHFKEFVVSKYEFGDDVVEYWLNSSNLGVGWESWVLRNIQVTEDTEKKFNKYVG